MRREKIPESYLLTPTQLQNRVYDNVSRWQHEYQQKRPRASEVGLCARLSSLKGLKEWGWFDKGNVLKFYANQGIAMEDSINHVFDRSKMFITTDWKMPNDLFENLFNVGGVIDNIQWVDESHSDLCLLEIKNIKHVDAMTKVNLTLTEIEKLSNGDSIILDPNNEQTSKRIKETTRATPKASHKAQAEIYSAITGIDTTYICLVSRGIVDNWSFNKENNLSHNYFPIDISDQNLAKRIASIIYAQRCVDFGLVADKPKNIVKSHCSSVFCNFFSMCWDGEPTGLTHIESKTSIEWKKEAYEVGLDYITRRKERYQKTLSYMHEIWDARESKNNN